MNAHAADPLAPAPVRTTCPYCGVGCGVLASPDGRGGATIAGDPAHPANFGRLCSKGTALAETLGLQGRLLHPMLRRDGGHERTSWSAALDAVADGLRRIIDRDGPDAVAFYLSGQLLTEDYYVANKLMKGFIGSANVDTNSRLCMASSVAGHRRAFGTDTVPCSYEDIESADLIVLVGANSAWCHPVLFQRMLRQRAARGARLVVIDPRRTETAAEADLFLPIAPGTDTALFCGLLVHLADSGALDHAYIAAHTSGFEAALAQARAIAPDLAATAAATGLPQKDVTRFFAWFAPTARTLTCFSQGVNQSAQGTDKVNAIINCHLATGRIGPPGMGPFSLTGQPNAMGGREVGGLANQLAAHMGFTPEAIDRVRRFWNAPRMAQREGLKAVALFDAIGRGAIKALWVMGTNPAVSLPAAGTARDALRRLDLFVVSDVVAANDTIAAAPHVLLPAAAWGEKDGTVTNSERRISRQRAFLPLPGEARPDWWAMSEVARRLGFAEAFAFAGPAAIFREHAALSAFENDGARAFDIGAMATLSDADYQGLAPLQWPAPRGGTPTQLFSDGRFFTEDGRARFVAPEAPALRTKTDATYPFRLNTGRIRDQWHTMTRSGRSPRLGAHRPEPFVEIHPDDAAQVGVTDGGFGQITTAHGRCILKVAVSGGQRRGSLFVPIHWSDSNAASARIGGLVAPHTDPHSGQPEAKATPAAITPVTYTYRGFALSRVALTMPPATWWARVPVGGGDGYLFASDAAPESWAAFADTLAGSERADYVDAGRGIYRVATFREGQLEACLFVGPAATVPDWAVVKALFEDGPVDASARRALLSGRGADAAAAGGPLVCACFGVGLETLREAVRSRRAVSVEAIGRALKAGTNCGSCVPELRKIVDECAAQPA